MKTTSKRLSRQEMKQITGGTNNFIWNCWDPCGPGWQDICSTSDPTSRCSGLGYSMCTNTGVHCGAQQICIC